MIHIKDIINSIFTSKTYILHQDSYDKIWIVDIGDIDLVIDFLVEKEVIIAGVFLTHTHADHIYGLKELLNKYPDCLIYTSEFGVKGLKSPKLNFSTYHDEVEDIVIESNNIRVLHEGDIIPLFDNVNVEVFETPGHDKSCLTYKIDNYIFTGDSYIPGLKTVTNFPNSNKEDAKLSEEKILQLAKNCVICPGHGEMVK